MSGKFVNHWGKWVNSEVPVTGVQGINTAPEWLLSEDGIALGCEDCDARKECRECAHPEDCTECQYEDYLDTPGEFLAYCLPED